eukprot:3041276-Prymnesium_polylepis.1
MIRIVRHLRRSLRRRRGLSALEMHGDDRERVRFQTELYIGIWRCTPVLTPANANNQVRTIKNHHTRPVAGRRLN